MLSNEATGSTGTLIIMLHWLGGSSRTWTEVSQHLAPLGFRCVAIDLPGFGASSATQDFSIPTMVREVTATIRDLRREDPTAPWLLAGHSMGGKLSTLIARSAEANTEGLANLRGLVLLSPSPPSPEPMKESQRASNIRDLGPSTTDPEQRHKHAATFVDDNTGKNPLLPYVRDRSIADVLSMNPEALVAWMTTGSKLDCSSEVGILNTPALILAGNEEPELNPEAQTKFTVPHFATSTGNPLTGSGHLSPIERPAEVADRIATFSHTLGLPEHSTTPPLSESFSNLIHSDRTSPATRDALLSRLGSTPTTTGPLTPEDLLTLRALAARIVPDAPSDLASRLNATLAEPKHDGWRFNALPNDADAWHIGLASLDAASQRHFSVPFLALHAAQQDDLLHRAQQGDLSPGLLTTLHLSHDLFNAAQIRDWFEDVRGELTKLYVADPRTMQRIGFTGFADNAGFTHITLEDNHLEPTSKEVTQ